MIIVDADLRLPDQHKVWSLSNEVGLLSVLTGKVDDPSAALQETSVPGLRVMTSGPQTANPTGLLASATFDEMIGTLCEMADLVVVDTPPLLSVADTTAMSRAVPGVLLVVRAGVTTAQACAAAADL